MNFSLKDQQFWQSPEAALSLLIQSGINLLAAILIFVIGKWVIKRLLKLFRLVLGRANIDPTLIGFLANVIYGIALTLLVLTALAQIGIQTTSAAAILGGAALAVGLALKDQLSSFAAGVLLILFRPFRVGDVVEVGGTTGVVEQIKLIHTVMLTFDHQRVVVPNSNITTQTITNFSAMPTRRVDLTIGIGYSSDLQLTKQTLLEILQQDQRILPTPEPSVVVKDLSADSVDFAVRAWVNTEDWWVTRCDLIEKIKLAFDQRGIEIPFPQRSVHIEGLDEVLSALKAENTRS